VGAPAVSGHYRRALLRHLRGEFARLKDPALNERCEAILEGFDQAIATGIEPSPWLESATKQLQRELGERQGRHSKLLGELDRWIAFRSGTALERN
jgi:hypothetical protein